MDGGLQRESDGLLSNRRCVLVTDPTLGIPTAGSQRLGSAHLNGCALQLDPALSEGVDHVER